MICVHKWTVSRVSLYRSNRRTGQETTTSLFVELVIIPPFSVDVKDKEVDYIWQVWPTIHVSTNPSAHDKKTAAFCHAPSRPASAHHQHQHPGPHIRHPVLRRDLPVCSLR